MNFLAPLFLAGAAAIALPLYWHLIRRQPKEEISFSALRFLKQSTPTVTRRSRLEHLLLLSLRCLAFILLACAFARPFVTKPLPLSSGKNASVHRLILVDTSASMRRPDLWKNALSTVRKHLTSLSASDAASVFTFDRQPQEVIGFQEWLQSPAGDRANLAASKLASIEPGWDRTETATALITAARRLHDLTTGASAPGGRREIVLVTDFAEGSRLEELRGYTWPKEVEVTLETLLPAKPGNAAVQATVSQEVGLAAEKRVRLRGFNAPGSTTSQLQIDWVEANSAQRSLAKTPNWVVPPGQTRVLALPTNVLNNAAMEVRLSGDTAEFDNTFYLAPSATNDIKVLFVEGSDSDLSASLSFYLDLAFPTNSTPRVRLERLSNPAASKDTSTAIALLPTSDNGMEQLRSKLTRGETVLCLAGGAQVADQLRQLTGAVDLEANESSSQKYQMWADIDFSHPLFRPLSDARFNDFTKVHFWKHRVLSLTNHPSTRVLARFEDQSPAWVEFQVGKGRLHLLTSTWAPTDSQLALSTKFVPLLFSFLDVAGSLNTHPSQYLVGMPIEAERRSTQGAGSVLRPDGKSEPVGDNGVYQRTDMPGFYRFMPENRWIAVNLPPEESRSKALEPGDLERLGVKLMKPGLVKQDSAQVERKRQTQHAVTLESQQRLWRWFLLAALVVLALESLVANRYSAIAKPRPAA